MTYIIGEIGQNHNGSVDIAKLIIDLVNKPVEDKLFNIDLKKIDAIKLTKRDLSEELTQSQMDMPYTSPNAFADTYGAHREALELSDQEHFEIYKYANGLGFDFIETLCSIGCLSLLKLFTPTYLKVASRDLTNIPLLAALSETQIPMILSTGMAGRKELDDALEVITKQHSNISVLHCVSEYPTQPKHVNLNTIDFLQEHYSNYTIGYSDHTVGISTPVAAVAKGAKIIEKHITIDRDMKGTDQKGSLGPDGVMRMVRDIRLLEMSLGEKEIKIEPSTKAAKKKLERSIATNRAMKKGEVISIEDIHLLSPGDGFKWAEKDSVLGKVLNHDLPKDELIYPNHI